MASIRKTPSGSYQAKIYVGRDANGKQMFKYVTREKERDCKTAVRKIEQELEEGTLFNIPNMRLSTWIEQWLEINKGRLSPSTFSLYKTYYKLHYGPGFGNLKLSQLNEIHLKKFMNEKLQSLSRASVRRMMSPLKVILYDALKKKSPAQEITLPSEEKYSPKLLSKEEMETIHESVRGTKDEPIILLAAWCGLRRGEIFALKWDDVDWTNESIRIDESFCVTDDNLYVDKRPKSENGVREVIVPEYLLGLLDALKKKEVQAVEEGKKPEQKKENPSRRIFNMRPDNFSSHFAEMIRKKNLPRIRFHDLRHYHASWLYAAGIPDQYAAQRLGHDIRILKGIYQHLGLDRRKEIDDNIRQLHKNIK